MTEDGTGKPAKRAVDYWIRDWWLVESVANEECKLMQTTQDTFGQGLTPTPSLRQAHGRLRAAPRDLRWLLGSIVLIRGHPVRYVQLISDRVNPWNLRLMRITGCRISADQGIRIQPDLFDNCRESSTNRPPFLQNKANLPAAQNSDKLIFDKGL
jgi:hypothetical protein